jgi:DNA-binding transcriptional LysR family regulator
MRDHLRDLVADGFDMAVRFGDPPVGAFTVRKLLARIIHGGVGFWEVSGD